MKKKSILSVLAAFVLSCQVCAQAAPPVIGSESACLMDAQSGQILYEKNAHTKRPMASITKVMTALLIIENGDLTAKTTATAQALATVDADSTRIGFVEGENLTVDELMYCMMVYSANDAANILAAYLDGDVQTFVNRMNERAKELGCVNTHFANPNGLDSEGHYSCAEDMARITYAANAHPEFAKYSGALTYQLPADNIIPEGWSIGTKVNMYQKTHECYDPRIYAAKTGWTTKARNTFVACAKSDEAHLIVSALCAPVKKQIFMDTSALLDYGEKNYACVTVLPDDYKEQAEQAAEDIGYALDTEELTDIQLLLPKSLSADDLRYVCAAPEHATPYIAVMVSEDCAETYLTETGMHAEEPLLRVPVKLTEQKRLFVPDRTGSAHADLPQGQRMAVIAAIVVGCAALLVVVMRFVTRRKKTK